MEVPNQANKLCCQQGALSLEDRCGTGQKLMATLKDRPNSEGEKGRLSLSGISTSRRDGNLATTSREAQSTQKRKSHWNTFYFQKNETVTVSKGRR
jgi:hypothetical protein